MNFHHLEYKISYVHKKLSSYFLKVFAAQAEQTVRNLIAPAMADRATFAVLDLLYAMARHQAWQTNDCFQSLLANTIAADYQLGFSEAKKAVQDLVILWSHASNEPIADFQTRDSEFIKYLIVYVAESENEKMVEESLGLGYQVIADIKRFISEADPQTDHASYVYYSDYQTSFYEALAAVTSGLREKRWSLDVYSLKYKLLGSPVLTAIVDQDEVVNGLLDLLLMVGEQRTVNEKHLENFHENEINQRLPEGVALGLAALIHELLALDLLYVSDRQGKRIFYSLTEQGQQLTASIFANWYQQTAHNDLSSVMSLNRYYQTAVMQAMSAEFLQQHQVELLQQLKNFAEPALISVVKRMIKHFPIADLQKTLILLLESSQYPWEQSKLVRGLLLLPNRREILKYLHGYLSAHHLHNFNQNVLLLLLKSGVDVNLGDFIEDVLSQKNPMKVGRQQSMQQITLRHGATTGNHANAKKHYAAKTLNP